MKLTWFGHSAFRVDLAGASVLIDPFLSGNPSFKGDVASASKGISHIVLTHGHGDHVGDTVEIAKSTGAMVIANYELCTWLGTKGIDNVSPLNHGGGVDFGPFHVTMTHAIHSSIELIDGEWLPLGEPAGVVIKPAGDERAIYHMGDTEIFSDMGLIAELHEPKVVIVPIGDRFTMGPRTAAVAVRRFFPRVDFVVPCHYGTFPMLTGTVAAFRQELGISATKLAELESGGMIEV
jgi:L-ascorbate metabolism protein UlaG (beta-lactamase superfamily)